MNIKIAYLSFPENKFRINDVYKIRGYLGNLFRDYDLFHNHKPDGTFIYRYPLIQCKVINRQFFIIAIQKAIEIFSDIFFRTNEFEINNQKIILQAKELKIKEFQFGISQEIKHYKFLSPWIALNQKNFELYKNATELGKIEVLKKCLVGNILAICHRSNGLNYDVNEELKVELKNIRPFPVMLKKNKLLGFNVDFSVNFDIPKFLGVGKEASRGFGVLVSY